MSVITEKMLPQANGDFYAISSTQGEEDQALLRRVRDFLEAEVTPIINQYWIREEFPHHILPQMAELHIMGLAYQGYGCPGKSSLLDGMMMMELARVDSSIATFRGVHSGLAMGSIYLCGSEEQKQRWLPSMARLEKIGSFGNARLSDTMYPRADHDVHLITLPLFHSFGQTVQMNAGFYNRATLVLLPRFSPDAALHIMDEENITIFAGVPTMYWAMLHHPRADQYDLQKITRNLRVTISGGAAMPVEVMLAFNEKFNVKILEGYGLSETSPIAVFNRLDREVKPGSIGLPVWGVQVRVVDQDDHDVGTNEVGEIVIRGHNVMKGYYKRPEATAEAMRNGWFHTGDLARRDEDGYFSIVDRAKDMIIRGGFNVYPREIEEVLMTHPVVSLAAVIGVPHKRHGEEVKAFVLLKAGATITEVELVAWSKQNMADYKYPRLIEFRTELPMTATGKS